VACREKAVFVKLALISPLRRTASPEGEAKGLFYREKVYKKEVFHDYFYQAGDAAG
jgi:hypothetical protein